MKKFFAASIIYLIFSNCTVISAVAADFGNYGLYGGNYQAYGLAQTLENQKRRSAVARQRYNYATNPTRKIKYPTSYNPYPNIQQSNYQNISAKQRYSSRYYENMYR